MPPKFFNTWSLCADQQASIDWDDISQTSQYIFLDNTQLDNENLNSHCPPGALSSSAAWSRELPVHSSPILFEGYQAHNNNSRLGFHHLAKGFNSDTINIRHQQGKALHRDLISRDQATPPFRSSLNSAQPNSLPQGQFQDISTFHATDSVINSFLASDPFYFGTDRWVEPLINHLVAIDGTFQELVSS